jgi:uncharacterized protein YbcI
MNKNIETRLREAFIKLYKRDVGKGPIQTNVGITKNYIVVEFIGIFTKLEKNLLNKNSGEEIVRNLRSNLKDHVLNSHIEEVERMFQCKVIEFLSKLSIENDSLYLLFVLDKNIDNLSVDGPIGTE